MKLLLPIRLATPRPGRSLPRDLPRSFCANRWITTKSFSDVPFAYTWVTKTPEKINPDAILSSLPSQSPPTKDTTPLLLVTPQFAHWLDPGNDSFLPKLLRQLYSGFDPIHTVAAVVDKLPNKSVFAAVSSQTKPLENPEGEGLSLLVVPNLNVHGKAASPRRIGGSVTEETGLEVSIDAADLTTHQISLRLAHTIFVNGKESTLLGMRWVWDKSPGDDGAYLLEKSIDLSSCSIKSSSSVADIQSTLTLPLHPVGRRRKVISSMGNILREISKSTDIDSTAPIPASSELEKELPRYISENNIADQRVSVWALVEKATTAASCPEGGLLESLNNGGKLHRVMSGGGGWGKKQGLLSLDPEVSFSATAGRVELHHLDDLLNHDASKDLDLPPSFPDGIVGDDLSLLSQVATEGDFIQFYASGESTTSQLEEIRENDASSESISYCFGIVSDADHLDTQISDRSEEDLVVVPNAFGALSEKAITYCRSNPILEDQVQETNGWTPGPNTKLDIPGCRVVLSPVADSE